MSLLRIYCICSRPVLALLDRHPLIEFPVAIGVGKVNLSVRNIEVSQEDERDGADARA
jgi:hypothetical protein